MLIKSIFIEGMFLALGKIISPQVKTSNKYKFKNNKNKYLALKLKPFYSKQKNF